MGASTFVQYTDGELHRVPAEKPDSFRAGLYLYARRHGLKAKAYIVWDEMPHPVVVFRIGAEPLAELPGAPKRGIHSHGKN